MFSSPLPQEKQELNIQGNLRICSCILFSSSGSSPTIKTPLMNQSQNHLKFLLRYAANMYFLSQTFLRKSPFSWYINLVQEFTNFTISNTIRSNAMFWQGGGKKRLKHQMEKIMEIPQPQIDSTTIGKNDDELLLIYYYREGGLPGEQGLSFEKSNTSKHQEGSVVYSSTKENKSQFIFKKKSVNSERKNDFR